MDWQAKLVELGKLDRIYWQAKLVKESQEKKEGEKKEGPGPVGGAVLNIFPGEQVRGDDSSRGRNSPEMSQTHDKANVVSTGCTDEKRSRNDGERSNHGMLPYSQMHEKVPPQNSSTPTTRGPRSDPPRILSFATGRDGRH